MTDITAERVRELLHYDPETGVFARRVSVSGRRRAGGVGSIERDGYIRITICRHRFPAHRLAWFYQTGEWPGADIDHVNGDRADNRLCNLREATRSRNCMNARMPANNTSGFKGVIWDRYKRKWRADIKLNGKNKTLGLFASPERALSNICSLRGGTSATLRGLTPIILWSSGV
jgi:hypothetical protein